jgi:hypothetical protein
VANTLKYQWRGCDYKTYKNERVCTLEKSEISDVGIGLGNMMETVSGKQRMDDKANGYDG